VTRSRPALALAVAALAYALVLLDTSLVNVGLTDIRDDLGASVTQLQWVVNGYALVLASLLLSAGALTDRIGARRMLIAATSLFAVGAAAAALAPSTGALVGAQVLLGTAAAGLVPASLTLLTHNYPDPVRRARALGVWAAISASSFALGPVIGGLLIDTSGWRLMFAINLPFAIAVLALLTRVGETSRARTRGLDLPGQATAIVALAALTFAIVERRSLGWSSVEVLGAIALALASGVAFLLVERRGRAPMLPLAMLRSRRFSSAATAGLLINFAVFGQFFLFSLYFEDVRGLSALQTGLAFLPQPLLLAVAGIPAGLLAARVGPRLPLTIGGVLAALGALVLLTVQPDTSYLQIVFGLMLFGAGAGGVIPAVTAAAVASVPSPQVGIASATLNASRQMGGVLGVAVLGGMAGTGGSLMGGTHTALLIATVALAGVALLGALGMTPRRSAQIEPQAA
jgi:DHA2 family methylenomycin A resistance protein-like MFS transporter